MSHDLLAELAAYRSELAGYERSQRVERVVAVRAEIDRVTALIHVEAAKLVAQAENHEEAGQDVLAAQARVEARRLKRAAATKDGGEPPAAEDTADSTPTEKAVTRRGRKES